MGAPLKVPSGVRSSAGRGFFGAVAVSILALGVPALGVWGIPGNWSRLWCTGALGWSETKREKSSGMITDCMTITKMRPPIMANVVFTRAKMLLLPVPLPPRCVCRRDPPEGNSKYNNERKKATCERKRGTAEEAQVVGLSSLGVMSTSTVNVVAARVGLTGCSNHDSSLMAPFASIATQKDVKDSVCSSNHQRCRHGGHWFRLRIIGLCICMAGHLDR
jgi:hypothetical protein